MARAKKLRTEIKPIGGKCCMQVEIRPSIYSDGPRQCRAQPAYEIDGKTYCFGHAGQRALSILQEQDA